METALSDFLPAFNRTMNFEGYDLEDVPGDSGGLTFCGIAQNPNPTWQGWPIIQQYLQAGPDFETAKKNALADKNLWGMVEVFYEDGIWAANFLGQLVSQELANQAYDAIVNLGTSRPVRWLQMLVNVEQDGKMGPETVEACNNDKDPASLVLTFIGMRKAEYESIVTRNPEDEKFLDGWLSRCMLSV